MKFRDPIVHLSESAILQQQEQLSSSVVSAWIARMVDAGWWLTFFVVESPDIMFAHSDDHHVQLTRDDAFNLLLRYWYRLDIPTPYNWREVMVRPLVRPGQEAPPDEILPV